jgi:hypothetical protein
VSTVARCSVATGVGCGAGREAGGADWYEYGSLLAPLEA